MFVSIGPAFLLFGCLSPQPSIYLSPLSHLPASGTTCSWENRTLKMVAFGLSGSMDIPNQSGTGIALFVIGALLFIPGLTRQDGFLTYGILLIAAVLLTVGTYLFGTSGGGRPV